MRQESAVLIVDDDANLRRTLSDILRLKGYANVTAATGAEAVAAAAAQPISLALIDLMLPDMPGMEVMARIKAISPLTEAIILTGHASMDTAIEATRKGAFSYLLKPYQMDDLLRNIRHGVERQQAQAEIARLASYPRLNPVPVVELDADGELTYANPAAGRLFPDLHDLGPRHPLLAGLADTFAAIRQGGPEETLREVAVGEATYEEHVSYVRDADVIRIFIRDISVRTQAVRLLARRERQQTAVAELGTLALGGGDLATLYEQATARAAAILGAACCLVLELPAGGGALLLRASTGCDAGRCGENCFDAGAGTLWGHTLASGEPTYWPDLARDSRLAGPLPLRQLGVASGITLALGPREQPLGVLGLFSAERREFSRDETNFLQSVANVLAVAVQRKRAEEEISQLASTDSLTGIANRRAFIAILDREIERARRYGPALSIIMYDLDHFKQVNDAFGHDVGDEVLRTTTAIVKRNIRAADVLARWGGEEFLILIAEGDIDVARGVAEKLRQTIAGHSFEQAGQVTASFGVTTLRPGEDMNGFLKRVDDALYGAKTNGRNRVETI